MTAIKIKITAFQLCEELLALLEGFGLLGEWNKERCFEALLPLGYDKTYSSRSLAGYSMSTDHNIACLIGLCLLGRSVTIWKLWNVVVNINIYLMYIFEKQPPLLVFVYLSLLTWLESWKESCFRFCKIFSTLTRVKP